MTIKLMTRDKGLHPRYAIERFYMSRKYVERVVAIIEDSVDISIRGIKDYFQRNIERLITATS